MMNEHDRRHLAAIFAEDDRLRAEREQWMAKREAVAAEPDRDDLVYREHENIAPPDTVAAPMPDADEDDPGMFADPELDRAFGDTIAHVICGLRGEWRDEIEMERVKHDRALAELRGESIEVKGLLTSALEKIAKLEGQIDTLLAFIGQRSAARSVIEDNTLPDWRRN
jgi:hypothetical protein